MAITRRGHNRSGEADARHNAVVVHRRLVLLALSVLVPAGAAAAAADGTVSITLKPDRVAVASTLSVVAQGPFPSAGGVPSSVRLDVQRGFKSDRRSVSVLCTPSQARGSACPEKSKVGSGNAWVHVTTALGLGSGDYEIPFELFLGSPQLAGDLASVTIEAHAPEPVGTVSATGRLLVLRRGPYGLELRFDKFPKPTFPAGTTVTLNRIALTAGASRVVRTGKGRHRHTQRYALITNPPACHGNWTAQITAMFENGAPFSRVASTRCRRH